jgi:hypothetical protein
MALHWLKIVLIVAAVFCIIELGLTGHVASAYNGGMWVGSPPVVNFMIFNSVWSLLVLAYIGLTPIYMTKLFHGLVAVGLEVITTIFWFAGSIALAVAVGGPWSCGANTYCGAAEAAVAFGFFIWYASHQDATPKSSTLKTDICVFLLLYRVLFTVVTVMDARDALHHRNHPTSSV